ncbi:phytoene/squalene synthase family protein [Candidatus Vallotiella sp. (ex Adelges kitamiensis)]|uniref:phytoene/squalene synthase family protein n=1 Tax=Candidatus Vallotiella sp. (ex Adelges kitamiensis) TaxID=2864217 RepID=UPI001CE245FB|nr:phytoene/squalene synthase family protein [Candidatus Vallotia sp. (ex Adelges kitamiensis)]
MRNSMCDFLLGPLLKSVSRSFYLTLRVLPVDMRYPVGLAYLLARAADTITDMPLIKPALRLKMLLRLRAYVNGEKYDCALLHSITEQLADQQRHPNEQLLLESIKPALEVLQQLSAFDRVAVRRIVLTLTRGMEFDLTTFPYERSGRIVALCAWHELDQYTYMVAGCVGAFWTEMTYAYFPNALYGDPVIMTERAVCFGKALQLTNLLRDCAKDLRIGRCYIPSSMLERYSLTPQDLLSTDSAIRVLPIIQELTRYALAQFRDAINYMLAIRRSSTRLRLACLWPIVIGLKTLFLLASSTNYLVPELAVKMRRQHVYKIIAVSIIFVNSNTLLRAWLERLITATECQLYHISSDRD